VKLKRFFPKVVLISLLVLLLIASAAFSIRADFDGDGFADLAIGVSWEDVGSVTDAGAVNIMYGTSGGLHAAGDQIWDQDDLSADTNGSEERDYFGQALAMGDLNGDNVIDLVVGVPGDEIGTAENGGAVHVLYGMKSSGLSASGDEFWHQGSPGIKGAVEENDWFGQALAIGDFNGDGYGDLAVGAPLENIEPEYNAGSVNVIYGSSEGLTGAGDQIWYEGNNDMSGAPEADDNLGNALAAGDFNADGYDDLAVAIYGEDLGGENNAGRVTILYGSSNGLSAADSQNWVQGLYDLEDQYEENDYFGRSLATGDFNGDRYADLAIGVPNEDIGTVKDAGIVHVLYGSNLGLTAEGNEVWALSSPETNDRYGISLVAGDFNGDGFDELAVGIPENDLGTLVDAGSVEILYGGALGLRRRPVPANDFWHQDRSLMEDKAEEGDKFGTALAAGDFNGDAFVDLAVGICYEDVASKVDAGAVQILYGSSDGISEDGNQFWHQDSQYIEGGAEADDHYGCALASLPPSDFWVFLPVIVNGH